MDKAVLVTVDLDKKGAWSAQERSAELAALAASAGAHVAASEIVRRHDPVPSHFIGTGKTQEISLVCARHGANLVIFNNDLAPTQARNLESAIGRRVIDRTQLILDIFARRARSNEGKLQVELAQLSYTLPRLSGKGASMSRLGGGIGTRGPGEQKLEYDRRRIRDRMSKLRGDLEKLRERRSMMRKRRERFMLPAVSIVGYTNAGKSTLLNALTGSDAMVRDKLFATLDPTARQMGLPGGRKILLIDTVGFLSDLPHGLIEAFKATLEEVVESEMLLHVVDASHPKALGQIDAVNEVLNEIGAGQKRTITAINKIDSALAETVAGLMLRIPDAVCISAMKQRGLDALKLAIADHIADSPLRPPESNGSSG